MELTVERRCSLFCHHACLSEAVLANQALRCYVDASLSRPPHHSWKRRPSRPRNNWLEHIHQDSGISWSADLRCKAIKCGHGTTLIWHYGQGQSSHDLNTNRCMSLTMFIGFWEADLIAAYCIVLHLSLEVEEHWLQINWRLRFWQQHNTHETSISHWKQW